VFILGLVFSGDMGPRETPRLLCVVQEFVSTGAFVALLFLSIAVQLADVSLRGMTVMLLQLDESKQGGFTCHGTIRRSPLQDNTVRPHTI